MTRMLVAYGTRYGSTREVPATIERRCAASASAFTEEDVSPSGGLSGVAAPRTAGVQAPTRERRLDKRRQMVFSDH